MDNTFENRYRVTESRHITVHNYPKNWKDLPEYQDFYNGHKRLCGFVEMETPHFYTKYLTSTIY